MVGTPNGVPAHHKYMATLHEQMQSIAWDDVTRVYGESVTYTPVSGSAVSRVAVIERGNHPSEADAQGLRVVHEAIVSFRKHVTYGVASWNVGDKVTFDSQDWFVTAEDMGGTGSVIRLNVIRSVEEQPSSGLMR